MPQAVDILKAALEGRYLLERELGRGGMATVYLARDLRHERDVALKVLDAAVTREMDTVRFTREVRTTAGLNHPHILPLFDSGEAAGHLFYVMPVVEGASLEDRLRREGALPAPEAVRIASGVARALAHAHDRGIVHRDVKPGNVLVHHGQPVLADFGISLAADAGTRITGDGVGLGTPHYMSPEQVDGAEHPDGRADQYALACLLFEMLTGKPPFPRTTPRAVLTAHLVEEPPALPASGPWNAELDPVIRRALSKEPAHRYPGMAAFAEALEAAAERGAPGPAGEGAGAGGSQDAKPGLVVLPFDNLSSDPENEYFSDGLTEEVIADLSSIGGIRVISRTSAMRLKSAERDLRHIARELDVRYALEGGVRKSGDRLRITARLIDARSDEPLWSERFNGTMEDVFRIQEEVALAIAEALRIRISPAEAQALSQRPIDDPRAYESYLRARFEAWRFSPEALDRATLYIRAALDLVGENELLLGTLGHITAMFVESGVATDPGVFDRLEELAERLFTLNPDSPRGHWLRTFLALQRGDMSAAVASGRRSVLADPNDPDAMILLAYVLATAGRTGEARTLVEKAVSLDPLTPVTRLLPGYVAAMDGRHEDVVGPYRAALEIDPESPITGMFMGWALAFAGRAGEAIPFLHRFADRLGEGPFAVWARILARGLEGDREGVARAVTPEFEAAAHRVVMFARALADGWALVGEADRAIDWLEQAVELGMINEPFLREYSPFLYSVREHPRFEALMQRVRARAAALP